MPSATPNDLEKLKQSLSADNRKEELQNDKERYDAQRAFDVSDAVTSGKMPTTKQAVAGIDKVIDSKTLSKSSKDIGPEARKVLADTEQILEAMKETLIDKNSDDELQKAIYFARNAITKLDTDSLKLDSEAQTMLLEAKERARAGMNQLIDLSKLLISSSEFRDLLSDWSDIFSSVVRGSIEENKGDLTENVLEAYDAEKSVNNTQPGAENWNKKQWESGKNWVNETVSNTSVKSSPLNSSTSNSSVVDTQVWPGTSGMATQSAALDASEARPSLVNPSSHSGHVSQGQSAQGSVSWPSSEQTESAYNRNINAYTSYPQISTGNQTEESSVNKTHPTSQLVSHATEDSWKPKEQLNPATWTNKEQVTGISHQPLTQESRDAAHAITSKATSKGLDLAEQVKKGSTTLGGAASQASKLAVDELRDTFGQLSLNSDLQNDLFEQFRSFLIRMQARPEYVNSIQYLISMISDFVEDSSEALQQLQSQSTNVHAHVSRELSLARKNFQTLIENFAQHQSLEPLTESLSDFHTAVVNDWECKEYFKEARDFFERALLDSNLLAADDFPDRVRAVVERGNRLASGRYGEHIKRVSATSSDFISALREDDVSKNLSRKVDSLVDDLTLDDRGEYTVKTDMLRDLAGIIPTVVSKLGHLPIPRIEFENDDYHVILDNIVVECRDLIPEYIEVATDTVIKEKMRQAIGFKISRIRLSARDIAFYYQKKSGLMQVSDVGLLDFDMKGKEGVTIKVLVEPELSPEPGQNVIARRKVVADIDKVSIKLHKTKRDFLYTVLTPLFKSKIKKLMAESLENAINQLLDTVNVKVAERNARAAEIRAAKNPVNKLNEGIPQWGSKAYEVEP